MFVTVTPVERVMRTPVGGAVARIPSTDTLVALSIQATAIERLYPTTGPRTVTLVAFHSVSTSATRVPFAPSMVMFEPPVAPTTLCPE
jgi:hypothetical protein